MATAMRESLAGGKRLRARLLLQCHWLCGGGNAEKAWAAAAAVEILHAYSLIHDDLPAMDNSDTRRNLPSCHKKYGEATAVLVGDGLLTLAFGVLAENGLTEEAATLAKAAGYEGMIEGQMRDLGQSDDRNEPQSKMTTYSLKTAALFSWAAATGARLAGRGQSQKFAEFGRRFGLLFQLADDVEDGHIDLASARPHLAELKKELREFIAADSARIALEPMLEGVLTTFQKQPAHRPGR